MITGDRGTLVILLRSPHAHPAHPRSANAEANVEQIESAENSIEVPIEIVTELKTQFVLTIDN